MDEDWPNNGKSETVTVCLLHNIPDQTVALHFSFFPTLFMPPASKKSNQPVSQPGMQPTKQPRDRVKSGGSVFTVTSVKWGQIVAVAVCAYDESYQCEINVSDKSIHKDFTFLVGWGGMLMAT